MTSRDDFYSSPEHVQIQGLQDLACCALERWSLGDAVVSPVAYRENMTFSVDAGSLGRFALRVHQAGYRTDAQVQSELDFMEFLRGEGILTPEVVRPDGGASFAIVGHSAVPETRQCDLFEWIDGTPIRRLGEPVAMSMDEAEAAYFAIGRLSASVFNASEKWERPPGFERPSWDAEGIFGVHGHLGDFRMLPGASPERRKLLDSVAERVSDELAAFGREPDRYGLCQADLLPENVLVCEEGLRLIDFDDAGDSWALFDLVTSVWDLRVMGSDHYQSCLRGVVNGFRDVRALPEEHLALLPAFLFARVLSYLAHTISRSHLEASRAFQSFLVSFLEAEGSAYVRR